MVHFPSRRAASTVTDNPDQDYCRLVTRAVCSDDEFVGVTFSGRRRGFDVPWTKVTIRPVLLRGRHLQFTYYRVDRAVTKNFRRGEALPRLRELLDLPFSSIHLRTTDRDVQVRVHRKGAASVHVVPAPASRTVPELKHDQSAETLLGPESATFLKALGITTGTGELRAGLRDKFQQINEFLRILTNAGIPEPPRGHPLHVVDLGCGSAHLTFAAYHYLHERLGIPTKVIGADIKAGLLDKHRKLAESLGWGDVEFQTVRIADFNPPTPPDIVFALHACDTATDEALAQSIRWRSKLILSVPCCHHHLQELLSSRSASVPQFAPVWRHGILRERTLDIVTDTFRALLLRRAGYRTDIIEFVSNAHTARNLMIRAVRVRGHVDSRVADEYMEFRDYWGVTPYLEELLADGAGFGA